MSFQITNGRFQAFTSGGDPLTGGKLYTYVTGTTTPLATYTDATLTTPNTNPILLDARGEAQVWLGTGTYRFKLNDATDVNVWTTDGIVDSTQAVLGTLSPTSGAGLVGFDWATSYAAQTAGWGVQTAQPKIPALKYIPINLWAGLAAGSDTTDCGPFINQALSEASVHGGAVMLPPWTLCISTTITWSARGVSLQGVVGKEGNTASAPSGTNLKWTGSTGATMVQVTNGAHRANLEHIMFDANDKADTCLAFLLVGGASQQIHFPSAHHLRFNGYRGKCLVFGNPDITTLDACQMQMARLSHCTWGGGGATATVANVIGLVLNSQNCEILNCDNLYFDPFTSVGGGPNIDHQSHIVVKTGGLHLSCSTMTRADSYDIDVVGECGLVVDHVRTEDPLFLRMASSFPSNPISITNVQGRDGTSTGTEVFMSIGCGGGQSVWVNNIHSSGHIQFFGANVNYARCGVITWLHPGVSAVSLVGSADPSSVYDLEPTPGNRVLTNPTPSELWQDASANMLYRNSSGKVRVTSLQGVAAGNDGLNFGGAFTLGNATTATVTFATPELDTNYRVICVPNQIVGGTPAAGSGRIASIAKTVNGFTVTFEVSPGAGNQLAFAWFIFRA